jgi:hypothetical protein
VELWIAKNVFEFHIVPFEMIDVVVNELDDILNDDVNGSLSIFTNALDDSIEFYISHVLECHDR